MDSNAIGNALEAWIMVQIYIWSIPVIEEPNTLLHVGSPAQHINVSTRQLLSDVWVQVQSMQRVC